MRQIYYRVCLLLGIYKREDFVTAKEVVKYAIVHYPVHPFYWDFETITDEKERSSGMERHEKALFV